MAVSVKHNYLRVVTHPYQSVVCENLAKRQKDSATAFSKKAKKQASASGTAVTL